MCREFVDVCDEAEQSRLIFLLLIGSNIIVVNTF